LQGLFCKQGSKPVPDNHFYSAGNQSEKGNQIDQQRSRRINVHLGQITPMSSIYRPTMTRLFAPPSKFRQGFLSQLDGRNALTATIRDM
jgi:hypothetical protein